MRIFAVQLLGVVCRVARLSSGAGDVFFVYSQSVSFGGDDDVFVLVGVLLTDFHLGAIKVVMICKASDSILLGLFLSILSGGVVPLKGVNPHIPPSGVGFRRWLYPSGSGDLFELIGGVVDVALLVWALVLSGMAAVRVFSGGSVLVIFIVILGVLLFAFPGGWVVSFGGVVAVNDGTGDALAAKDGAFGSKAVFIGVNVPPPGHHPSDGVRLTGGGFAAEMATIRFLGDVVAFFAFIVNIDVVSRHSGVVIGLGVPVIMVFLCFFSQSVALEDGPAELVVRIPLPGLVRRVVFGWGAYSVPCSKGSVLVIARQVVAFGASDLGGDVLESIVVELGPSTDA